MHCHNENSCQILIKILEYKNTRTYLHTQNLINIVEIKLKIKVSPDPAGAPVQQSNFSAGHSGLNLFFSENYILSGVEKLIESSERGCSEVAADFYFT